MISKIEDYIEGCRLSAFSASEITVQKEELEEKLSELRMAVPKELGQSRKILSNRNTVMLDAQAHYNAMVNKISKKTEQLVNQFEIVQETAATANEILQNARVQAQSIVDAA